MRKSFLLAFSLSVVFAVLFFVFRSGAVYDENGHLKFWVNYVSLVYASSKLSGTCNDKVNLNLLGLLNTPVVTMKKGEKGWIQLTDKENNKYLYRGEVSKKDVLVSISYTGNTVSNRSIYWSILTSLIAASCGDTSYGKNGEIVGKYLMKVKFIPLVVFKQ